MGTKKQLAKVIKDCTGIPENILHDFNPADTFDVCIAQKRSWAAGRVTARPEDRAYSLLRMFNVNMPLLYREGEKAFYRLQVEITKQSYDLSILGWSLGSLFQ